MREIYLGSSKQGASYEAALLFLDTLGAPVTGLTHASLLVSILRKTDVAPVPHPLTALNFIELGSGFYRFLLSSLWTLTDGPMTMIWSGVSIETTAFRVTLEEDRPGLVEVTLVADDGTTPQPSTQIDIWDNTLTQRLWTGSTDLAGEVVTALLPGTYKVYLFKPLVVFTAPENLTVVGPSAESHTFSGTPLTIPLPTAPDRCVVYGNVYDISGIEDDGNTPAPIVIDIARVKGPGIVGGRLYTADPIRRSVQSDGSFSVELAQGITVLWTIERCGIRKQFVVPLTPSVSLASLL